MALSVLPQVLKSGGQEDRGELARIQYFVGAIGVGDLIKSTLGPKGTDKILQPMGGEGSRPDKTTITNDGATILKSLWIDNPAAKILVDLSKQQDAQWGDGTTGVVVLAAELLQAAERLVQRRIHPQVICAGYRLATDAARKALDEMKFVSDSESEFMELLKKVALTTLSSKLLYHDRYHFASLAVEAILRLKGKHNLEYIQIIKKTGGSTADSYLDPGFVLEKTIGAGHPKCLEKCNVLVANTPMDTDKIKIYGARVRVDSFKAVQRLEQAEKDKMKEKIAKIASHNCNVFINRQLIYNYPDQIFKDHNILAIEHADFIGVERLAAVLGASLVSTFDEPSKNHLGYCDKIEETFIGDDPVIRFSGCKKTEACSIILRGANQHILEEAERSLHDALAVLSKLVQHREFVYGAGAAEMWMANAVDELSRNVEGKKSLAIEAFASALRQIPTIICNNAGVDSAEIVSKLRAEHFRGEMKKAIDLDSQNTKDADLMGVLESYKVKESQLCSASEAAEMIIRVDDLIRCAPRRREGM